MLACAACGRAYKARALTPWSLSTATCPSCGGDLSVVAAKRPIEGQPPVGGRFVPHSAAREQLSQRLTGLGA
jgi:uncharacterized protein YbaR (Trm112 family)